MDSEIKLLIQETANRMISLCTLMTQSPTSIQGRASLSNKVQPSSMKTLEVETLTYMPSAGLLQKAMDHTCHHPHRFNELAIKSGIGSPDWRVSTFQHPSVDLQSWTSRSECRWPAFTCGQSWTSRSECRWPASTCGQSWTSRSECRWPASTCGQSWTNCSKCR